MSSPIKQKVWENKSNGQLCVTIPKTYGLKAGSLVELREARIRKVVYSVIVADLFHYGILHLLKTAQEAGDLHICGLHTDEVAESYRGPLISSLKERMEVIKNLRCVDRVIAQDSMDPTENLKKIKEEFPDAQIVFVWGSHWKEIPGHDFLSSINADIIRPDYYPKLSNQKILEAHIKKFKEGYLRNETFTERFKVKNIVYFDDQDPSDSVISTKADTLRSLRSSLRYSRIEDMFVFTSKDWHTRTTEVLKAIQDYFDGDLIVVRSSAINEDTLHNSMAGYFLSVLDVHSSTEQEITQAITNVLGSYSSKKSEHPLNQVLIQRQSHDVKISGVILTREIGTNAPYYVINYDDISGRTDTITSGKHSQTTRIFRQAPVSSYPARWYRLMIAIHEIEQLIARIPLDIEFAIDSKGDIIIFQVRPLAANISLSSELDSSISELQQRIKTQAEILFKRKDQLAGETTVLSDMSDWNPAEIIGDRSAHLDYSLYDNLITGEVWHKARASLGYACIDNAPLVHKLGNKSYVDVRASFNSLLPHGLPSPIRERLIQFYLLKLKNNPHLHDKVEFDILHTCYDLSHDKKMDELRSAGFNEHDIALITNSVRTLTTNILKGALSLIDSDLKKSETLAHLRERAIEKTKKKPQDPLNLLSCAQSLLDDCKELGTLPFARLARLAFIGKALLRSLRDQEIISQHHYDSFLNSIRTVASELKRDFSRLSSGTITREEFLKQYGHLRPGTYSILAKRYDQNPELLDITGGNHDEQEESTFEFPQDALSRIDKALRTHEVPLNATQLLDFISKAIEARELCKFEFTKNLSLVLELFSQAGAELGLGKEELASLDVQTLLSLSNSAKDLAPLKEQIMARQSQDTLSSCLMFPALASSPLDFDIVESIISRPNYITQKTVAGKLCILGPSTNPSDIKGTIVVLENGDPGYDWIFTKKPLGLITKYGGVASHMAIRCAEFGIPAAIGTGDLIYQTLTHGQTVTLDCKQQRIKHP